MSPTATNPKPARIAAPAKKAQTWSETTKLDEKGKVLAKGSTKHSILVLPHAGIMLDVRGLHRGRYESCVEYCNSSQLLGRKWRPITVEEAFLHVCDRTRARPARDPSRYPKLGSDWIWCGDEYAGDDVSSPVCAWGVNLNLGDANFGFRGSHGLALPVSVLAAPARQ